MKALKPQDEFPHEVGTEANFNESMYFNLYDPARGVGGFLRLAKRPNEGRGERTVCLHLPDGTVAFDFARPTSPPTRPSTPPGCGWRLVEPYERLDISYTGDVMMLDDPDLMTETKAAFATSPRAACSVRLTCRAAAPVYEHSFDGEGESFAPNHYKQLMSVTGTIRVGDTDFRVDGFGLRDHSWGPRSWQTPWYYRWLTGNCGADFGFMGAYFGSKDDDARHGGFVWDGGTLHPCEAVELETSWTDSTGYHQGIRAVFRAGEREWPVTGRVLNRIPLRNRRRDADGDVLGTRITEGLTRWETSDGRTGYGMSEYLDQMIDGRPVAQNVF
ncbi:DUF7064 domain-containing protein [Streptomyces mirabilis]|uniref:DUF7064 domain-containing protein n=1 Tax=Streptomyces mirabilis TaxID=68239 RepID=UPI00332F4348